MFGFIAFGFKLLFAAIAGGALSYIPGEETQNHKIVETSLICIFGAAIPFLGLDIVGAVVALVKQFGSEGLVGLVSVWVLWGIYSKK